MNWVHFHYSYPYVSETKELVVQYPEMDDDEWESITRTQYDVLLYRYRNRISNYHIHTDAAPVLTANIEGMYYYY
jgi:hypothetical protein